MSEESESASQTAQEDIQAEKPKRDSKLNAFTIVLVLAFLLILLAQSVGAGMLTMQEGKGLAKPNEFTKAWEECKEIGKSDAACYKTATAIGKKSPTPKLCDPYKPARPVQAGETFDQFIQYYGMNSEQIAQFIKINGLSPAYPNTIIYTGLVYCLPYGVDKKKAEGAYATDTGVTGFDPNKDFYFTLADIHWNEISFDLYNFPPNDKVTVWYWNKPPYRSGWKCQKSIDDVCVESSYDSGDDWSGPSGPGYSNENNRRIFLVQFKVTKKRVTLVFPEEVGGWNGLYVCMHSLKRDEMDQDKDRPASYHPSYHSYCQYISMSRPQTTAMVRIMPTEKNPPTRFPINTPCGYLLNPFWNGNAVINEQLNYSVGWVSNPIVFNFQGDYCYNTFIKDINCSDFVSSSRCSSYSMCHWIYGKCQSVCEYAPSQTPINTLTYTPTHLNDRTREAREAQGTAIMATHTAMPTHTCVASSNNEAFCTWNVAANKCVTKAVAESFDPDATGPKCMPECPGTRVPTPTNTPCSTYGSCPGTRVPYVTPESLSQCFNYPSYGYHIEFIPTETSGPSTPACSVWWKTPVSKR